MKTWEEINNALKFLPAIMSLHRLAAKTDSQADRNLIASILGEETYLLEFDKTKKTVLIGRQYEPTIGKYYTGSCFHCPDVFLGLK